MNSVFDPTSSLSEDTYREITRIRVEQPEVIAEEAARRTRRRQLTGDGRLVIVAADHPGRQVTAAAGDPLAMADRHQYLARIVRILRQPNVDGVMSTPDILDELLILSAVHRAEDKPALLDEKVMLGCMNRGGLAGTAFELRDRFGAFTARQLEAMRFDGAKMMFRLDPFDRDSGRTIQDCAEALRSLSELRLAAFVEPLPVEKGEKGYRVVKTAKAMAQVVGVATALGVSSSGLWLKIPYVEDYVTVAAATTCPILMLGGASRENPMEVLAEFEAGLKTASNIRGVLVGRNILFPGSGDPGAMAAAVGRIVHEGVPAAEAGGAVL